MERLLYRNKKLESSESNPKVEASINSNMKMESKESINELDDHPLKTGIVIERSDYLYLEREDEDGNIFYDEVPLYQDVERSIQLIAKRVTVQ